MDMFDIFTGKQQPEKKPEAASGTSGKRGGYVERRGMVVRVQNASVLFFDDASQQEIFVPLSQVKDWWFTASSSKRGFALDDCELDDEITICIPRWLAKKEGMV
ncbi:MAG: hypothetical protein IJT83_03165 [Victivallales bacterium]|nr:hypothetical protein [Victivallales bacterium]